MKLFLVLSLFVCSRFFAQTPPTAQFNASPTSVCIGSSVQFLNLSVAGTASISTYSWDFGDGTSSNSPNPMHVYSVAGTYSVTLTVQATNGQADFELKNSYITVFPQPSVNFNVIANGCVLPVGVSFTNTTSGGNSYIWNFGNGQTSNLTTPASVNYTTPGTYIVSLISTSSNGCKDTLTKPIVISDFQAGIIVPATACVNSMVAIQDNSTVGANAWSWSFAGASLASSSAQNNTISYSTPGTYTISLSTQNTSLGCSGNASSSITILPLPEPSFSASPNTGCAPQAVTFVNNSGSGSFSWNFGDGTPLFSGNTPPPHIYTSNGTFNVTLTMTGSNGCTASISQTAVTLIAPIAAFSADVIQGCSPLSVNFTNNSSSSNPIVSYAWDFGNGQTSSLASPPVQTYLTGVYDVSLTVTTASGCVGNLLMNNYIQVGHIDLVDFGINETPECAKVPIDFTNQTVILAPHTASEISYSWDFGDGGTSTLENPSYSYPSDTGTFDVQLIVNFRGCLDTLIISNAVYIKAPISIFSPAQTLYCNPVSFPVNVVVNDNSKIGKLSDDALMTWFWGDGTQTMLNDPDFDDANLGSTNHNYTTYGTYTIKQVIINSTTGCSDSTNQVIYISQTIAGISPLANDSVCVNTSFSLDENSNSTHPFGTFSWNLGNGQTINGATPSYSYPSFGAFTITLTATNSVGCSDTETFSPLTALALPLSSFSIDDAVGCAPHLVEFTNTSLIQNNGAPIETFTYTFSDNSTTQTTNSIATNVSHTFNTEGVFPVVLVSTDEFGCSSVPFSSSITITKPNAQFSLDTLFCDMEEFISLNTTSGVSPLSYVWSDNAVFQGTITNYSGVFNDPNNIQSSHLHVIRLIATDANGCKDTIENTIKVLTPFALLDASLSGAATNANGDFLCPPVFATFNDQSISEGTVVSWVWNFGDGKTSTQENPANTYVFAGVYSASLQITDEYGCVGDSTYENFLTIFGPSAIPNITQDVSSCGQIVTTSVTGLENVSSSVWDMGDGTSVFDSLSFEYTYQSIDYFLPVFSVTDNNNCVVQYPMDTIFVPENGLNAFFTYQPGNVELGTEVLFEDQSSFSGSPIVQWSWDFTNQSDSILTTSSSVLNGYVYPGVFPVTLSILDANGCIDSHTELISVSGEFTMPNVITSGNGDGVNDLFLFKYPIFKRYDFAVIDRWGVPVFEAKDQTSLILWDGKTEKGNDVVDGVYFYVISGILKDGSSFKKDGFVQKF